MKKKTVMAIVMANLAAVLLLVFIYPHLMVSPGKLIDAHLELTTDCFTCHSVLTGSSPEKCIQCHKVEEIGLKTTKGLSIAKEKKNVSFHQKLLAQDCIACHSDHKGVQAFRPISQFSHQLLEPAVQEQCDGCHSNPSDTLHQNIKGNCGQCHTEESWTPATFDHDEYFRFDKDHTTECNTCHMNNDYSNYTCYGCHEHSRSKIREEHVEEGIYDYENCVECHRGGDEDEAKYLWKSRRLRSGEGENNTQPPGLKWQERKHHDDD
jgi:hypothetical protein